MEAVAEYRERCEEIWGFHWTFSTSRNEVRGPFVGKGNSLNMAVQDASDVMGAYKPMCDDEADLLWRAARNVVLPSNSKDTRIGSVIYAGVDSTLRTPVDSLTGIDHADQRRYQRTSIARRHTEVLSGVLRRQ